MAYAVLPSFLVLFVVRKLLHNVATHFLKTKGKTCQSLYPTQVGSSSLLKHDLKTRKRLSLKLNQQKGSKREPVDLGQSQPLFSALFDSHGNESYVGVRWFQIRVDVIGGLLLLRVQHGRLRFRRRSCCSRGRGGFFTTIKTVITAAVLKNYSSRIVGWRDVLVS